MKEEEIEFNSYIIRSSDNRHTHHKRLQGKIRDGFNNAKIITFKIKNRIYVINTTETKSNSEKTNEKI